MPGSEGGDQPLFLNETGFLNHDVSLIDDLFAHASHPLVIMLATTSAATPTSPDRTHTRQATEDAGCLLFPANTEQTRTKTIGPECGVWSAGARSEEGEHERLRRPRPWSLTCVVEVGDRSTVCLESCVVSVGESGLRKRVVLQDC